MNEDWGGMIVSWNKEENGEIEMGQTKEATSLGDNANMSEGGVAT